VGGNGSGTLSLHTGPILLLNYLILKQDNNEKKYRYRIKADGLKA